MLKLFVYYWLVAVVIVGARGRANKCRLVPFLRTYPSQLYPNNCKVTVSTFICTGFCESRQKLVTYKPPNREEAVPQRMVLQQDCNCCTTTHNSIVTFTIKNHTLSCADEVYRTEKVVLATPTSCGCHQCGRRSLFWP